MMLVGGANVSVGSAQFLIFFFSCERKKKGHVESNVYNCLSLLSLNELISAPARMNRD